MIVAYTGIIFVSTYFGYLIARKYKDRYEVYKELYDLLSFYKYEVCYSQKKLYEIVKMFYAQKTKDYLILSDFIEYLQRGKYLANKYKYKSKIECLTIEEINQIENILNSLGNYDVVQENAKVEKDLTFLSDKLKKTNDEKVKYYNLYIKIGVIVGSFIVILIL